MPTLNDLIADGYGEGQGAGYGEMLFDGDGSGQGWAGGHYQEEGCGSGAANCYGDKAFGGWSVNNHERNCAEN